MPIYEFVCDDCGNRFEKLLRSFQAGAPSCPTCEGQKVTMQLSTFATHSSSGTGGSMSEMPSCPSGMCQTPGLCGRN